ncbi:ionotropic receptor 93a-like [Panulirus ornatus]|uniref:ionotropic receptor 93a-like n=1 Tax=Panulirus ornatus TaxID=150431 RepID=UPI003A84A5CF
MLMFLLEPDMLMYLLEPDKLIFLLELGMLMFLLEPCMLMCLQEPTMPMFLDEVDMLMFLQKPDVLMFLPEPASYDHVIIQGLKDGQQPRLMVLMTVKQTPANTTQTNIEHLMKLARQVRQSSWCLTVVVTSDEPTFLKRVAHVSREVRLLVWRTRLLLVGHVALPEVFSLLQHHWSFSMMNTMFINLNQTDSHSRCGVYVFLPYTKNGPKVVKVADYWHQRSVCTMMTKYVVAQQSVCTVMIKYIVVKRSACTVMIKYIVVQRPRSVCTMMIKNVVQRSVSTVMIKYVGVQRSVCTMKIKYAVFKRSVCTVMIKSLGVQRSVYTVMIKYVVFKRFHGAVVPVTALILPPFWKSVGLNADGKVCYSGRDYLMMAAVARSLNFTIELHRSFNIDEVLAKLEDGRAMIFAFRVMLIPQVLTRVDHTYFIDRATFTFTMRKPIITHHWQNLYYPLANQVWLATLGILLLLPGVYYMVMHTGEDVKCRRTLRGQDITLELVAMLVGQELWLGLPRRSSTRLILVTWLIFCFILTTAYRGNLIAFLTVPKLPARPENMDQLAAQTGLRAKFIQNATRFLRYFQESKLNSYKSVGGRADIVVNVMAGLQEISETRAAFFHERYNTELYIAEHFTSGDGWTPLYVAKENVIPNYAAWMMPHDAPYKENVDRSLLRLIESGLKEKFTDDMMRETWQEIRQRKQQQYHTTTTSSSSTYSNMNLHPLSLTHVQGPFWLLLMGLIMATLSFLREITLNLPVH